MAKFCRKCGRPLVNGSCPVCDRAPEPQAFVSNQPMSGSAEFFSSLPNDLNSLFASRDIFRMIPAVGFVVLALICLLQSFFDRSYRTPYALLQVTYWLEMLAFVAVGLGAVKMVKQPAKEGADLVMGCVSSLMGVTGVVGFFSLLANKVMIFNYLLPCLFILTLGLGLVLKDQMFRILCLGGAAAIAVLLLLLSLTSIPFLPALVQCYCALCGALFLVKSGN